MKLTGENNPGPKIFAARYLNIYLMPGINFRVLPKAANEVFVSVAVKANG